MNTKLLTIMLTDSCHGDCKYCYQKFSKEKLGNLAVENIGKIEELLPEIDVIQFFGGEPLLEERFIFKLDERIDYLIQKNILSKKPIYVFSTNLTFLTDAFKRFLWKLKGEGNNPEFIITVDGEREVHDKNRILKNGDSSYENLLKNYNFLIENGFSVETIYIVYNNEHLLKHLSLKDCLTNITDTFSQVKYVLFNFEQLFEETKISEEMIKQLRYGLLKDIFEDIISGNKEFIKCRSYLLQELMRIYDSIMDEKANKVKCLMEGKKISITPNGKIFMCIDQYYNGKNAVGNLQEMSISKDTLSKYTLSNNLKPEKCQKCSVNRICRPCPLKTEISEKECQERYKYNTMIIEYLKKVYSDKNILKHFIQYSQIHQNVLAVIYYYIRTK